MSKVDAAAAAIPSPQYREWLRRASLDDSGFGEFFIEFLHVRQELWARQLAGFRILRCLNDHHDFHWLLISLAVLSSACFPLEPFATRRRYMPPIGLTSMTPMVDCGICR